MHPDEETLLKWINDYETVPRVSLDEALHHGLTQSQALSLGTSIDLLGYLKYIPDERDQAGCGDCWVWTSTGVMEIALSVQNGIKDRLSTQFFQSCKTDSNACCGGNLNGFTTFYEEKEFAIPWNNPNASFQDGLRQCEDGLSFVSCSNISTTLNYPITHIQPVAIPTQGVGQSMAIANIKNVLQQSKGIYFAFFLPTKADWLTFQSFWYYQSESALWSPDSSYGKTWVNQEGGGHAVLIVGYNDDDPDPNNHYWIILNSWGTANGNRPNGLFRMSMYINYDCDYYYPSANKNYYSLQFMTLDVTVNAQPAPSQEPNLTSYQPQGWSDKIVVTNVPGTTTNTSLFLSTDTLYVNFAVVNDSDVAINSTFHVDLYVDGVLDNTWSLNPLNAHSYGVVTDYSIGSLSPGTHTIKIVADSTGAIAESNEGDNEYVKTITVKGNVPGPDLTGQWTSLGRSCKFSRRGESCKISGSLRVINTGELGAKSFYVDIYLSDNSRDLFLQSISVRSLGAGLSKTLKVSTNLPPTENGSGKYIVVVIDAEDYVDEADKENNILINGPIP